jgi:hypothetical protein
VQAKAASPKCAAMSGLLKECSPKGLLTQKGSACHTRCAKFWRSLGLKVLQMSCLQIGSISAKKLELLCVQRQAIFPICS